MSIIAVKLVKHYFTCIKRKHFLSHGTTGCQEHFARNLSLDIQATSCFLILLCETTVKNGGHPVHNNSCASRVYLLPFSTTSHGK